jgi:hypothetical protein
MLAGRIGTVALQRLVLFVSSGVVNPEVVC